MICTATNTIYAQGLLIQDHNKIIPSRSQYNHLLDKCLKKIVYYIIKKYVKTLNVKAIATLEEMQGKQYSSVPSKINNDKGFELLLNSL